MGHRSAILFRLAAFHLCLFPVTTIARAEVLDVAAGANHACAVIAGGTLKCWGDNSFGKLGDGSTSTRFEPVEVVGLGGRVVQVAAGTNHTCALMGTGRVKCWGSNEYGQLGNGSRTDRLVPTEVRSLASVTAVAAGGHRSCALLEDGRVVCWGWAHATFSTCPSDCRADIRIYDEPIEVPGFARMRAISASPATDHAIVPAPNPVCGVDADDVGRCIGRFDQASRWDLVVAGASAIATGGGHLCVVTTSGQVQCRGSNRFGQLGGGIATESRGMVTVAGIDGADGSLALGGSHSCALTADMRLRCWGVIPGDGTWIARVAPVPVAGLATGVRKVASGGAFSCAIRSDGSAWCWGANGHGQLGDGTTTDRPAPVAVAGLASGTLPQTPGAESGIWWSPSEPGWGIQLTIRRNVMFATWYAYDESGRPKWYVASDCRFEESVLRIAVEGPMECEAVLHETSGPRFFGVPFNPFAVRVSAVGTLRLFLADRNTGSMTYRVNGVSRTIAVQRFLFGAGAEPAVDYTDLWWDSAEAGWGLSVTHRNAVMFAVWYVYDDSGKPVWYVASGCSVSTETDGCVGTLYRTTGPPSGVSFDPAAVRVIPVGEIRLEFPGPNQATLFYTVDGVSGTRHLTRQVY